MTEDFADIYGKLHPVLEKLENKRQELKAEGKKNGLIAAGIIIALGTIIAFVAGGGGIAIIIAFIIAIIAYFSCIGSQSKKLSVFYKQEVIARIVSELCEGAQFEPAKGVSEHTFRSCGLFSTAPDRYHAEDLISGKIDKTTFLCSEVHAEEKRVTHDSKGRRQESWCDIFRGFLFIADFQKDFKGHTLVARNSWIKFLKGQRVKLENPDFEKNFDVYSTDQIEARYILSPSLMERLMELDRKFPGQITVSFYNSNVYVAIPERTDHFEASIWRSLLDEQHIKAEFGTICALLYIVNDLNLNTRIWTKE